MSTLQQSDPYPPSYYLATARELHPAPPLAGEVTCDVCVVGGGFTGIATALHLAERGYKVVVLEAQRVGWGASGRNGGQLSGGQRVDPETMEKIVGKDRARLLWELGEESKNLVKQRIARHGIDCDLKPGIIGAGIKGSHAREMQDHARFLRDDYGYEHVRPLSREELRALVASDRYHGGYLDSDAGHLHPLNYVLGLARAAREAGAVIHEMSPALEIVRQNGRPGVRTAAGRVSADFLVLACNGHLGNLAPPISSTIMPINNFVIATAPLGEARARALIANGAAVADSKYVIDYYRLSADHRLLFGGGESYRMSYPEDIAGLVRRCMLRVFPQLEDVAVDYAWGGKVAITMNRLPAFGRLEKDILYAQGFSGQGVALTTLAGQVIAEAVAGQAERFDVFAEIPTPRFPGGALLRWPSLVVGMLYYSLLDKL
ncbi:NAD(P)/FAD-dependent oxidoreductase [Pelagibius marinus]|uniref:NAD(P)/FAD-dependent oxidoreductase n=1 Tax=Pelagibius marinus TaxID=2762760 RepID=UPI001872D073|nr:FAD-binding oxidoreductase [Pelagibius marinus]